VKLLIALTAAFVITGLKIIFIFDFRKNHRE
jgi:hypothetical protein